MGHPLCSPSLPLQLGMGASSAHLSRATALAAACCQLASQTLPSGAGRSVTGETSAFPPTWRVVHSETTLPSGAGRWLIRRQPTSPSPVSWGRSATGAT